MRVLQIDKSQQGTGDNHAISALKFKILQEFLELGCHVLLSDVDIVTLQANPLLAALSCLCCSCAAKVSCCSHAEKWCFLQPYCDSIDKLL